jgi:hypothetical protein
VVLPVWNAVRHGKAEYLHPASGAHITVFRYEGQLYRSEAIPHDSFRNSPRNSFAHSKTKGMADCSTIRQTSGSSDMDQ